MSSHLISNTLRGLILENSEIQPYDLFVKALLMTGLIILVRAERGDKRLAGLIKFRSDLHHS